MSGIKMLASTAPRECLWPVVITLAASLVISACSTTPLLPYSEETEPLVLLPISQAGIQDERGRFREIFCTVLEEHGSLLPDYQHCDQALTRVGTESDGSGKKVELGTSERGLVALVVPGVGWNCFSGWLNADGSAVKHVRQFGYDMEVLQVDALSSSTNNARQIRDASGEHLEPVTVHLVGHTDGDAIEGGEHIQLRDA